MSGTGPTNGPAAGPPGQAGTQRAAGQAALRHAADQAGALPGGPASPRPAGPAGGQAGEQHDADPEGMTGVLLSGRYRLERRIAAGGMGEVWRGTDEVLGRPVAIKLLRHAYVGDEALASRFRAEARYAASLSHPGIAQVFDYGEQDTSDGRGFGGGAYLVMELVPGEPLSAIIARTGRLSHEVTLDIIAQAAGALQAAHAAGIVHRDIKPGNVLVTADGRVKITDFGIARAVQTAQAGHLTQTGMVMGTAQYVSPEQASGLRVTHASDVYSLGIVAYECLAGAPPFAAEALIALALAHVREVPPPLPPSVPPLVCDMVMRMLAKRPEDRPASALAVAERAAMLRDTLPGASGPGLAEMATEDPAAWFTEDSPASPRPHDGATTQIPIDDSERLPRPHRLVRRRALVVAALSVGIIGLGGVTTALMLNGHHAADAGGSAGGGTPSASPHPAHSTHRAARHTPSQSPPVTTQAIPPPPTPSPAVSPTPSPTASASPTPTVSPTPSPSRSASMPPPTSPPPTSPAAATAPGSNP